ncbi:hypothetical protein [Legionella taurinensis]|nr:hypothetical protein [Legionella taurinensis]MDX1838362.1 hypothetical protein [Legionella taurinensis]STY25395.1 Uncharacterised protein [Legionella taurinensis]
MNHKLMAFIVLFLLFCAHAKTGPHNVTAWVQQTLMDTLSASYGDTPTDIDKVKRNYYPAAWWPMNHFFRDRLELIKVKKLILHPKPLTAARITASGPCGTSQCWRINQSYQIPELSIIIDFSLLVVPANTMLKSKSPFLIQSLSLKINDY